MSGTVLGLGEWSTGCPTQELLAVWGLRGSLGKVPVEP